MTAGELARAVRHGETVQFLRTFCGTGVVFNGAPQPVIARAEAVSAHVLNQCAPQRRLTLWSDWRGYLSVDSGANSDVPPSPYTFRRGGRQTTGVLGRRGPQGMRGGPGEVPNPLGPPGDWVAVFGGWEIGYWEAPVEWQVAGETRLRGREFNCQQISQQDGMPSVVRGAKRRAWPMYGANNADRVDAFVVQPGFMLCNMEPSTIEWFVKRWGKPFCQWFASRANEARFLATRHRRQGAGDAFIATGNLLNCNHCGAVSDCQCASAAAASEYLTRLNESRVYELRREAEQVERRLSDAMASSDVVQRVNAACEVAMDRRFIRGARFDGEFAHIFMGSFEFNLDSAEWTSRDGVSYTWPAGRYRMPPVWLKVPWMDPGSVQVLDLDGAPHPHGHVGAGGGNGMPCLGGGGRDVQHRLVRFWNTEPYEFIMHWWNYMNQYNEVDRGIVGPIHTACELIARRVDDDGAVATSA